MSKLTENCAALDGLQDVEHTPRKQPRDPALARGKRGLGAAGAPGGKLASLIINCHGLITPANVFVGLELGTEIWLQDLKHFAALKSLVGKIYMTVCGAARGNEGKTFCRTLAATTGATVVAGEMDQTLPVSVWAKLKVGEIDNFEGQIYEFDPAGGMRPALF